MGSPQTHGLFTITANGQTGQQDHDDNVLKLDLNRFYILTDYAADRGTPASWTPPHPGGAAQVANRYLYDLATNILYYDDGATDVVVNGIGAINFLNVGSTTLATAIGDLAAGVTADAQIFWDQSSATFEWRNSSDEVVAELNANAGTFRILDGPTGNNRFQYDEGTGQLTVYDASGSAIHLLSATTAVLNNGQDNVDTNVKTVNAVNAILVDADDDRIILGGPTNIAISANIVGIVGGAVDAQKHMILAAQAGTADDLTDINNIGTGDFVILRADAGDTITILQTGNIVTGGGLDRVLTGDSRWIGQYDGANVVELAYVSEAARLTTATATGTTSTTSGTPVVISGMTLAIPEDGTYELEFSASGDNSTGVGNNMEYGIYVNGVLNTESERFMTWGSFIGDFRTAMHSMSGPVALAAGDTITAEYLTASGTFQVYVRILKARRID